MRFWEEAKFPSHHNPPEGTRNPHDITGRVTLHRLLKVLSAQFLHYNVPVFPFHVHTAPAPGLWEQGTKSHPVAGAGGTSPSPGEWGGEYLYT